MTEFVDKKFQESLQEILNKEQPKSILLITGETSYEKSSAKKYFDALADQINIIRYSGFSKNPQYTELNQALSQLNGVKPDLVIAIGGGSVIDFGKLLNFYLGQPEAIANSFPESESIEACAPLMTIPTTAGSGSEVTHFAVIYKDGVKYSIASDQITPSYVIVDPELTHSMSPSVTANSGVDALCQGIESLWAMGATEDSRQYSEKALELVYPNIVAAVQNPKVENRRAMALGAYYAGKAINISKTTGPHALSYYLTDRFGVPHGEAVAINMEMFIALNSEALPVGVRNTLCRLFEAEDKDDFIRRISEIKKKIGLRTELVEVGIMNRESVNYYLDSVNVERINNNPVKVSREILMEEILKRHKI